MRMPWPLQVPQLEHQPPLQMPQLVHLLLCLVEGGGWLQELAAPAGAWQLELPRARALAAAACRWLLLLPALGILRKHKTNK